MNRKIPFMMAVALLLGAATLPGVSVPTAAAEQNMQVTPAQGAAPTLSDQFFRVEWTVSPGRHGDSRITGYVYNQYGRRPRTCSFGSARSMLRGMWSQA